VGSAQEAESRGTDSHWSLLPLDSKSQPPAMNVPAPHFLLFSEAARPAGVSAGGQWRFVLKDHGGDTALEAADDEHAAGTERLELLAIVRGLEALDQPSKVTLMTGSRDIQRGLKFGLAHWRDHDWQWERYGQMTPVKNADLWQRIDRLLEIHDVGCRPRSLESADDLAAPREPAAPVARRSSRGKRLRFDQSPVPSSAQLAPRKQTRAGNHSGASRARGLHPARLVRAWLTRMAEWFAKAVHAAGLARE
jgi:ribonuclease HI